MATNSLLILQFQFTQDVAKLIKFASDNGFNVKLGECLRPPEMESIYKQAGKSWLTNPNQDKHLNSLAIDIMFFKGVNWITDYYSLKQFGIFWSGLTPGNIWGGDWSVRDLEHFQH